MKAVVEAVVSSLSSLMPHYTIVMNGHPPCPNSRIVVRPMPFCTWSILIRQYASGFMLVALGQIKLVQYEAPAFANACVGLCFEHTLHSARSVVNADFCWLKTIPKIWSWSSLSGRNFQFRQRAVPSSLWCSTWHLCARLVLYNATFRLFFRAEFLFVYYSAAKTNRTTK